MLTQRHSQLNHSSSFQNYMATPPHKTHNENEKKTRCHRRYIDDSTS